MNIDEKIKIIESIGEEIITKEDLKKLLMEKKHPVAYDGYEPSGNLHIAQGILVPIYINKLIDVGFRFKFIMADWHAWANNKMGGDLEKIQIVGEYMKEVLLASGLNPKVEFVWASDLVKDDSYWKKVLQISIANSVKRIERCSQIMGRKEDNLQASQILYPLMQCADIFHMDVDLVMMGMDQRKVNVLAREVGPKLGWWKPVSVHHHMLMGLHEPHSDEKGKEREIELKMSKSKPDSSIFMTDSEDEIKRKLKKAYCPDKTSNENPVLEYIKYIIFEKVSEFVIERPEKFGGDISFKSYKDLEKAYVKGEIHPLDLKNSTAKYLNSFIEPVRKHFEKDKKAKELMEKVKSFEVTR